MKNIRSIYSDDPGIRVHGLRIRRVRLNRHLPEARWVADHQHAFSQILLYLGGGSGRQTIAGQNHASGRGRLFFLPPGVRHAFVEPTGQKPLCLALDFDLENAPATVVIRQLNSMDLSLVRHALSGLTRWRTGREHIELSRWFRAQTGRTPSAWRVGNTETAFR